MSLIKVGLVVGSIVAGLFYWQSQNPEKHAKLMALVPFAAKPKETEEIVRNCKKCKKPKSRENREDRVSNERTSRGGYVFR